MESPPPASLLSCEVDNENRYREIILTHPYTHWYAERAYFKTERRLLTRGLYDKRGCLMAISISPPTSNWRWSRPDDQKQYLPVLSLWTLLTEEVVMKIPDPQWQTSLILYEQRLCSNIMNLNPALAGRIIYLTSRSLRDEAVFVYGIPKQTRGYKRAGHCLSRLPRFRNLHLDFACKVLRTETTDRHDRRQRITSVGRFALRVYHTVKVVFFRFQLILTHSSSPSASLWLSFAPLAACDRRLTPLLSINHRIRSYIFLTLAYSDNYSYTISHIFVAIITLLTAITSPLHINTARLSMPSGLLHAEAKN